MRAERAPLWKRVLREPLPVFLALGLAVFALDRAGRGGLGGRLFGSGDQRRIEITAQEIDRLGLLWSAQSLRPPSEAELDSLIEDAIAEEVLVREARRLGLDRDDTIVRRRLAQKMSFLIQDTVEVEQPTEKELAQFFDGSQERYLEPERTTFSHIFFSNERKGPPAMAAARETLSELTANPARSDWRRLGDPFLLNREYAERTRSEIAELFGRLFAEALEAQPVGQWSGPIESAYGQHLVLVASRSAERLPGLAEVRQRVLEDFLNARRREANRKALEDLRGRYEILVDRDPGEVREGREVLDRSGNTGSGSASQ